MAQRHRYLIYAGLLVLFLASLSELIIFRNVVKRHQKLDAESALSFIEARISGHLEMIHLVPTVPDYLQNLSWLLDELQSQPFLTGVLIVEKNRTLLDSFPRNRIPGPEIFTSCKEGKELDGVLYMGKNFEPEPGRKLFLLVGLETKFTHLLWREGLFYGAIVFFCSGAILLLYSLYVDHLIRKQAELEKKITASEGLLAMGKVAAMLSHEIRNPLNTIAMGLQYISELGKADPGLLQRMKNETNRLSELTMEFLSLSRGFDMKFSTFNLESLLVEIEYKFFDIARDKGVNFNISGARNIKVTADERWLSRALENLLRNSFEAVSKGGNVSLKVKDEDENLCFEVSDSGPEIAIKDMAKIFDPFFTTKKNGFGLGLFIVKKIAVAHGGTVFVEKNFSNNTVFVLSIPKRSEDI